MSLCFGFRLSGFNSYVYHLVTVSLWVRWLTSLDFHILLKCVGLLCGAVAKTLHSPCRGAWVQTLVRGLRSYPSQLSPGAAKKKKKKKEKFKKV